MLKKKVVPLRRLEVPKPERRQNIKYKASVVLE